MSISADEVVAAAMTATILEYQAAAAQLQHCLQQLTVDQIWWRPRPEMNSIGNLLVHLTGNLRQWVICGLGELPDQRNRPAEFAELGPQPLSAVWGRLEATLEEVYATLRRQSPESLLKMYRIQGFDVAGWDVLLHTVTHFRGHTQEITGMSRQILGENYQFRFVPATPEQGAPA